MSSPALILAALGLAGLPAFAAESAPAATPASPAVAPATAAPATPAVAPAPKSPARCRLLLVDAKKTEPWYRRTAAGEYKAVTVSTDWLGASLEFPGADEPLTLWRRTSVPGAAPEYAPVVTLPADGPSRRIVFLTQQDGKWRAESVSDAPDVFPNGAILAVNRAGATLRFDFGGSTLELADGATGVIAAPKVVAHESASIRLVKVTAGVESVVFSSAWPWSAGRRNILFARPVADGGIAVAGIDDIREPEPAPAVVPPAPAAPAVAPAGAPGR